MKNPPFDGVDWSRLNRSDTGRERVHVTCPMCGLERWADSASVRFRILRGAHTSRCRSCRLLGKALATDRPTHEAVDWTPVISGRRTLCRVTCVKCGTVNLRHRNSIADKIRAGTFTGVCGICGGKTKKRDWVTLSPGRRIDPSKGYIRVSPCAISPEDMPLYHAMRGTGTHVLEHRLVMARMIGRPLTSAELVDHEDGDKLNNDPSNLRIYLRGKNMPGNTSGYGTFYHEWQMALARIHELETLLAA